MGYKGTCGAKAGLSFKVRFIKKIEDWILKSERIQKRIFVFLY